MDRYILLQVIYNCCLAATCLVVWRRGHAPERGGAAILLIGSMATLLAVRTFGADYRAAQYTVLLVDALVLAGFLALVFKTDRYWPLWVSGFHLVGVATHLVILFYPAILPQAYRVVRGLWAYPIMAAIVLGALRREKKRPTNGSA